jgi:hypothetical protein
VAERWAPPHLQWPRVSFAAVSSSKYRTLSVPSAPLLSAAPIGVQIQTDENGVFSSTRLFKYGLSALGDALGADFSMQLFGANCFTRFVRPCPPLPLNHSSLSGRTMGGMMPVHAALILPKILARDDVNALRSEIIVLYDPIPFQQQVGDAVTPPPTRAKTRDVAAGAFVL